MCYVLISELPIGEMQKKCVSKSAHTFFSSGGKKLFVCYAVTRYMFYIGKGWVSSLKSFVEGFFECYLGKRNLEGTLSYFTEDVIYIGTGKREIAIGKQAVRELLLEEMQELPNPFCYDMYDYAEEEISEKQWDVFANFRVVLEQDENQPKMFARYTASILQTQDGWKVSCMHMSQASSEQKEGQFFPLMYGMGVKGKLSVSSEKELMQLAVTSLPGGVMGRYLEEGFPLYTINDKMLDILGYTYEELLEISEERVESLIYEEDRIKVKEWAYHQLKREEQGEMEYRLMAKGGYPVWVNDIARRIVVDSGKEAIISIISDITDKVRKRLEEQIMQQKMKVLAYTDTLTGLDNRTQFNEKLKQCGQTEIYACVVADINNLKLCNEKYGHAEGDSMIMDVAQAIKTAFQSIGSCYLSAGMSSVF